MHKIAVFSAMTLALLLATGCSVMGVGNRDEQQMLNKYQNEHSRTISVQGADLHYRVEGSGEPILLIHGVLSSLHTWDAWTQELKKNHTVYRIDLPGFGFSELPEGLYNDKSLQAFVQELVDKLDLHDFHIVGNSLGGYLAWNYALATPGRVKSLTVIDTVSYQYKLPILLNLVTNPVVRPFARHMTPKPIFSLGVDQVYATPGQVPAATKDRYFDFVMREGNRENFVEVLMQLKERSKDPTLGENIKEIAIPTLVMWGEQDKWIPVSMAHRWAEALPSAKLLIYPQAGHVPMEEIPEITVRDYQQFLEQLGNN